MGFCQYREQFCSLMDGCMMVVGLGHLLGIAVEKPIDRSLGRHRRYLLLCERLLDGRGPTVFAMLSQRLAQGHDDLCDALGRFGRGGSRRLSEKEPVYQSTVAVRQMKGDNDFSL
jgi:hypothetical protein